jgi:secreted trypsin-like serine protease
MSLGLGADLDQGSDAIVAQLLLVSTTPDGGSPQICMAFEFDHNMAVTAGHCLSGASPAEITVYWLEAGVVHSSSPTNVLMDPEFDVATGSHDLALIQLSSGPTSAASAPVTSAGGVEASAVAVHTWGGVTPTEKAPRVPTTVQAHLLSSADCRSLLVNALGDGNSCFEFTSDAGTTCTGDSGGPVLLDAAGGPHLIGVVSHVASESSRDNCSHGPVAFTPVAPQSTWWQSAVRDSRSTSELSRGIVVLSGVVLALALLLLVRWVRGNRMSRPRQAAP